MLKSELRTVYPYRPGQSALMLKLNVRCSNGHPGQSAVHLKLAVRVQTIALDSPGIIGGQSAVQTREHVQNLSQTSVP